MRLNERRNQECCRKKPMDCEERRLPMRVEILGRRLRGWFTLPRAWLSADKPKSRYPSELLRTFKLTSTKWKSSRILYFLSLAFTLFLHCQKLRYPRLDRARIKRNSRVSRIRRNVFTWFTYNSDQTTRRFEWTCVIAVRASMRAIRFDLAFRDFRVLYHICWSVEVNVGICSKRKLLKLIFRFFLCLIREFYELIRWSCHWGKRLITLFLI